ncbi:MAG: enoyl-CoA hydratase/isomerase family protein [Mesorhizobium sp.]|uniref:enoyl-CoA hydratase/isomerase family protein n=1 Tax=Mesorhizobium sp. TaxID=1871066 RepID=UPI000FE6DEFD|nr:enoyl-CoA hydratase/isomerase family protein [Mesorhizobium sp.]WIE89815.1 enoyl-CoA hydratase/isomerase family protein [Mesorhizobium sp. WSM4875]RWG53686.1 MAG: enoyl-CoA hydratase/isomerase family protein [Mesorhizobium sp.]RWH31874.1 MAG: enoyl-CoA hydratase/isomerase family protein [Mesorhizobium sp.]RWH37700.1 MAG: enoyl-CoA hydratase/isomerase family protein [Mesorhizobium sp.]RWH44832.1 MAG: enoyl-CoA hydratase/isomerase family protein [Mesorhizobium sp.]
MDFGGGDEIRFERLGKAGVVTLTRPQALNAVTHRMVKALGKALDAWEGDAGVAVVVVKAEGRAFSAGGDILHIYSAGRAGKPPVDFFADEYRLNARIARFRKPYVALIDGIVMGGGVGISFHGSHRVLTENAQFAMPEVGIGFFPDVGASHLLPDLGGSFGMYLGLTGNRIRYGDALWSGLATHTIKAEDQAGLLDELATSGDANAELRDFFTPARRETERQDLESIARHFSQPSLAAIVASLERASATDAFAAKTLATIRTRSPTSLNVAWREISAGSTLSMDECMKMEFRILNRMLAGHDFYEGIRAAIIDKGSKPEWRPASLDAVSAADVDAYFAPLGAGELEL